MKILKKTLLSSAMTLSILVCGNVKAGEELEQINVEVETAAAQVDDKYGVLLTSQERMDLKLSLIVNRVKTNKTRDSFLGAKEETEAAIVTYNISDPQNHRKLLIKFEIVASIFADGGWEPPE